MNSSNQHRHISTYRDTLPTLAPTGDEFRMSHDGFMRDDYGWAKVGCFGMCLTWTVEGLRHFAQWSMSGGLVVTTDGLSKSSLRVRCDIRTARMIVANMRARQVTEIYGE